MNDTIPFEIEVKVPANVDVKDVSVNVEKTQEAKVDMAAPAPVTEPTV